MSYQAIRTCTIASGATTSDAVPTMNGEAGSFQMPAAHTGATIQPQISNDATSWTDEGAAITVSVNETYTLPADCFTARYFRLESAGAEGADRVYTLYMRDVDGDAGSA